MDLRKLLIEQGVWEQEVDEVLDNFGKDVDADDVVVSAIFDSAFDLGENYIDNVVGQMDHHIEAVLNYTELGEEIADNDDEYLLLSTGRIIEFEM